MRIEAGACSYLVVRMHKKFLLFFVKERGHIYMPQLIVAVIVPILLISVFCCIVSGPKTPEEDYREREEQAEILTRMREEKASKGRGL